jgi:IPT/TIG domain
LFGGSPAASFSPTSDTQVTAVSPSGSGVVDVVVITAAGGASSTGTADQFTYIPAPTITSISPTSGAASGGTQVTINGMAFTGATAVMFGQAASPQPKVVSDTQITAVSPAGTPGTVDIVITAPGGTSEVSPADEFTYNPRPPTVTAVDPKAGPIGGNTQITITGTNFNGATAVTFGKIASQKFTVNSDTQIVATSPKGTAIGAIDVVVTTPSGDSARTQADQFTYQGTASPMERPRKRSKTKSEGKG